jgi:hypothetical protein
MTPQNSRFSASFLRDAALTPVLLTTFAQKLAAPEARHGAQGRPIEPVPELFT